MTAKSASYITIISAKKTNISNQEHFCFRRHIVQHASCLLSRFDQSLSNLFMNELTEGVVTMSEGKLFQILITLQLSKYL